MSMEVILEELISTLDVSKEAILGVSKKREITTIRQLCYYLCRKAGYELNTIGNFLGKDHSTVYQGIGIIKDMIDTENRVLKDHLSLLYRKTDVIRNLIAIPNLAKLTTNCNEIPFKIRKYYE